MKSSQKIDNAILFLSSKEKHNCRKKLAKLLYFVDFTNYEATSKSLTGLKYQKYTYGPMPYNFYQILEDMKNRGLVSLENKRLPSGAIVTDVIPKAKPNTKIFSSDELELMESIAKKYEYTNAGELENIAKDEPPYIMVNFKEEIPYHLAFYRNNFGEMDLENENTDKC